MSRHAEANLGDEPLRLPGDDGVPVGSFQRRIGKTNNKKTNKGKQAQAAVVSSAASGQDGAQAQAEATNEISGMGDAKQVLDGAGGRKRDEEDDEKAAEASAAGGAAAASDGLEMNPVGGSKASQVDDAMPGDGDDGR